MRRLLICLMLTVLAGCAQQQQPPRMTVFIETLASVPASSASSKACS